MANIQPRGGSEHSTISAADGRQVKARRVITCAGLYADRVAKLAGGEVQPSIIPFRGSWLFLHPRHLDPPLVQTNIYPVPNPAMPFLGFHLTPTMDGQILLGPNAVLAMAREGYGKTDINLKDLGETLTNPSFLKLAAKHWKFGASEQLRDLFPRLQLELVQRYVPSLTAADITTGRTGVRAQALQPDGSLLEDFSFEVQAASGVMHVRNAPSPAATSSLAIARQVVDKAAAELDFARLQRPQ